MEGSEGGGVKVQENKGESSPVFIVYIYTHTHTSFFAFLGGGEGRGVVMGFGLVPRPPPVTIQSAPVSGRPLGVSLSVCSSVR